MESSILTRLSGAPPETAGEKAKRLMNEARGAAVAHMIQLELSMRQSAQLAADVAIGGDCYPPGVRDLAQRLSSELDQKATTIQALRERHS